MDFGSFAGGMGAGLGATNRLRSMMVRPQGPQPQQPPLAPGYEDPASSLSVAGPGDFNPQGPQTPGTPGILRQIMQMLQGGSGRY